MQRNWKGAPGAPDLLALMEHVLWVTELWARHMSFLISLRPLEPQESFSTLFPRQTQARETMQSLNAVLGSQLLSLEGQAECLSLLTCNPTLARYRHRPSNPSM